MPVNARKFSALAGLCQHAASFSPPHSSIQPYDTAILPSQPPPAAGGHGRSSQVEISVTAEPGLGHCHVCAQAGCRLRPQGAAVPAGSESVIPQPVVFARPGWGSSEMPLRFQRAINHCLPTSLRSADPCLTAVMGFTVN